MSTAEEAGGVGPCAGGEAGGGDADGPDGEQRQRVDAHDAERGDEHGARVVALRVFDFLRDGGGVVPAHVVPHGDGECAAEIVGQRMGVSREVETAVGDAPEGDDEHDGEGRERDGHHAHRAVADGDRAAEVPERGDDDDGELEQESVVAVLEFGEDGHQVKRDGGGVDGHVEDRGGK